MNGKEFLGTRKIKRGPTLKPEISGQQKPITPRRAEHCVAGFPKGAPPHRLIYTPEQATSKFDGSRPDPISLPNSMGPNFQIRWVREEIPHVESHPPEGRHFRYPGLIYPASRYHPNKEPEDERNGDQHAPKLQLDHSSSPKDFNVKTFREESKCPPGASKARSHKKAGISASMTKAVDPPQLPAIPPTTHPYKA